MKHTCRTFLSIKDLILTLYLWTIYFNEFQQAYRYWLTAAMYYVLLKTTYTLGHVPIAPQQADFCKHVHQPKWSPNIDPRLQDTYLTTCTVPQRHTANNKINRENLSELVRFIEQDKRNRTSIHRPSVWYDCKDTWSSFWPPNNLKVAILYFVLYKLNRSFLSFLMYTHSRWLVIKLLVFINV